MSPIFSGGDEITARRDQAHALRIDRLRQIRDEPHLLLIAIAGGVEAMMSLSGRDETHLDAAAATIEFLCACAITVEGLIDRALDDFQIEGVTAGEILQEYRENISEVFDVDLNDEPPAE